MSDNTQNPGPPPGPFGSSEPPDSSATGQPQGPTSPPRSHTTSPTGQYPPDKPEGQTPGRYDPGQTPPQPPGQYGPGTGAQQPRPSGAGQPGRPQRPGPGGRPPSPPPGRGPQRPPAPGKYGQGQPPPPPPGKYGQGQPPPPPGKYGQGQPPPPPPGKYGQGQPPPPPGKYGQGQPPPPPPGQYGQGQPPPPPPGKYGQGQPPPPPGQYGQGQPPPPPPGQYGQGQQPPPPPSGQYGQGHTPPQTPGGETGSYPPGKPGEPGSPYEPEQPGGGEPGGGYEPGQPQGGYGPGEPGGEYQPEGGYEPGGEYGPGEQPEGRPDYGGYPPPDPCAEPPWWGPPTIPADCWPSDRPCCGDEGGDHPWSEVDDPCVRAAAWDQANSAKITCTCGSENPACCEEWECGGYPENICIPCKPCEGLLPDGEEPDGGDVPPGEGCTGELQRELETLKKAIVSGQTAKAKLDAEIKAKTDGEKELRTLVGALKGVVKAYRHSRAKLVCREDCLKRFHREYKDVFADRLDCLDSLQNTINGAIGRAEKVKCCQKNLEGKLTRVSRLVREKDEADKAVKKSEAAFKNLQDMAKWIDGQFAPLEALREQIIQAFNDADVEKHKWAFYLFYWKFVPQFCRRFPVAVCCDDGEPTPTYGEPPDTTVGGIRIGCAPADWHPSVITEEQLERLICCAWRDLQAKKMTLQEKTDELERHTKNLEFIKAQVLTDAALEAQIKTELERVTCAVPQPRDPEASAQ